MGDYQSLRVWAEAHELTLEVYGISRSFPADERFNLIPHIRKSAASVPSNLAEGAGRNSSGEFRRFCSISLGSANELHYQLRLAHDLGYLDDASHAALNRRIEGIRRMLARLMANPRGRA